MEKFIDKYRIPSSRLQSWDYGANAIYFITICTHHGKYFFGNIEEDKMILNEIGEIAKQHWLDIPKHFPFVILDAHIIMPNHIHGIVIINKPSIDKPMPVQTPSGVSSKTSCSTLGISSQKKDEALGNPKWKAGTLGVIINQYKRIVTINARKINPNFKWKSRFHDHIVRNHKSLMTIQQYIQNNPLLWKKDKFHKP